MSERLNNCLMTCFIYSANWKEMTFVDYMIEKCKELYWR